MGHFGCHNSRTVPAERLWTPADLAADYSSPRERLDAEGWPTVDETRNQVMFVLLNDDDEHQLGYVPEGDGLDRVLFRRAREEQFSAPWAAVAKVNNPADAAAIELAHAAKLLIASNVGGAGGTDEENASKLVAGFTNGSHMLCDDFPGEVSDRVYWQDLSPGTPSRCNEVTSQPDCDVRAIEFLPRWQ